MGKNSKSRDDLLWEFIGEVFRSYDFIFEVDDGAGFIQMNYTCNGVTKRRVVGIVFLTQNSIECTACNDFIHKIELIVRWICAQLKIPFV